MNQTEHDFTEQSGKQAERKALLLNGDKTIFGTFAEIGAGQEVARYFFRVGNASSKIAKSMSAYDMTFSDEIYGKTTRYVSRERLSAMLSHEYKLLLSRLSAKRGAATTFFAFANTVATGGPDKDAHGWLGVRFQTKPLDPPNDIIMHVRMTDSDYLRQQEALGIVGVNLMYAAFYLNYDTEKLVESLLDGLTTDRIEIDMLELAGPKFHEVDNRLISLTLIRLGLTAAIIFPPDGKTLQPSEVLYQQSIVVERGRFQPVTHLHVDMLGQARQYVSSLGRDDLDPIPLCEITLNNLEVVEQMNGEQLLAQVEGLAALGFTVLVSKYPETHRLISFLRRHTEKEIFIVAGIDKVVKLFDGNFYKDLPGGMLEGLGRFFRGGVTFLLYPMLRERFIALLKHSGIAQSDAALNNLPERITLKDIELGGDKALLLRYLVERGSICDIACANEDHLKIDTRLAQQQLDSGDACWIDSVPASAAEIIKKARCKMKK